MILGILLGKDLRRAWRNPLPYLIQMGVPLVITGLLGLVFSGGNRSDGGGLGRIRLAIVDEDGSPFMGFLKGGLNQGEAARHLDPVFLGRDDALRQVTNNLVAAALIIPTNFVADYVAGRGRVRLELVKNPAQQFHPAIVEELLGVAATALNAVARNFRGDLADWREVFTGGTGVTYRAVADLIVKTGEKADLVRQRLDPLPVYYEKEAQAPATSGAPAGTGAGPRRGFSVFAFILPGLSAMFLLFIADVAMRDLHRENRFRTFDRFCTLPPGAFVFVLSKVLFTFAMLMVGCAVLLGGGALIFGFWWRDPLAVGVLALGLAFFAGGLMAALNSLVGGEKKADVINTVVAMAFGLASGCAFPAQSLPSLLRDHVTPWLPPNWFVEGVRATEFDVASPAVWLLTAGRMAGIGLLLVGFAAWWLRRRLERGGRT